jgi:hypothetical protein
MAAAAVMVVFAPALLRRVGRSRLARSLMGQLHVDFSRVRHSGAGAANSGSYATGVALNHVLSANAGTIVTVLMFVATIGAGDARGHRRRCRRREALELVRVRLRGRVDLLLTLAFA